jgi:sec-independent protein translocase protein TatB
MFDVSWSELLILAIVALVCIGPKDLPRFMTMLGKYAGAAKRQAAEFRSHFDEAMREAELSELQKDMADMARDVNNSVMTAGKAIEADINGAKTAIVATSAVATATSAGVATDMTAERPEGGSRPVL